MLITINLTFQRKLKGLQVSVFPFLITHYPYTLLLVKIK